LLLACLAGPLSLYFAYWLPPVLDAWLYREPVSFSLAPDWRVFSFIAAISLMAGIFAGVAPARQSLNLNLQDSLKGRKISFGNAASGMRLRGFLSARRWR
jgi:hypothetical protein